MLAVAEAPRTSEDDANAQPPLTADFAISAPRLPQAQPRSGVTTAADKTPQPETELVSDAPPQQPHRFKLLQQWEGAVVGVENDKFSAVIRDLTERKSPEERADFEIDQIDPPDRNLITPGAVFYWSVGYQDSPTGTRWTVSTIRFRRLPAWTRSDMRRIERDVEDFRRLFAVAE